MKEHMVVSQKIHGRDHNSDINSSRIFVGQREKHSQLWLYIIYIKFCSPYLDESLIIGIA